MVPWMTIYSLFLSQGWAYCWWLWCLWAGDARHGDMNLATPCLDLVITGDIEEDTALALTEIGMGIGTEVSIV